MTERRSRRIRVKRVPRVVEDAVTAAVFRFNTADNVFFAPCFTGILGIFAGKSRIRIIFSYETLPVTTDPKVAKFDNGCPEEKMKAVRFCIMNIYIFDPFGESIVCVCADIHVGKTGRSGANAHSQKSSE